MAAALSRLDPGGVVLAFSWLDQSATSDTPLAARISESRTVPNGERLGVALNQAIDPEFSARGGMVHLLGHSHGAKVATIGALSLPTAPAQLTLLDSPDEVVTALVFASNDLVPYLRQLQVGRAPGRTFVDNYFSEFGRAYGNEPGLEDIVDVSLPPGQFERWDLQDRHDYPPRWYTAAAEQPVGGVGPMWSPLLGPVYQALGPYYVQQFPADAAQQLILEAGTRPPPPSAADLPRPLVVPDRRRRPGAGHVPRVPGGRPDPTPTPPQRLATAGAGGVIGVGPDRRGGPVRDTTEVPRRRRGSWRLSDMPVPERPGDQRTRRGRR